MHHHLSLTEITSLTENMPMKMAVTNIFTWILCKSGVIFFSLSKYFNVSHINMQRQLAIYNTLNANSDRCFYLRFSQKKHIFLAIDA